MGGINEFVLWSSGRFNSIDGKVRNTDRERRNRANRMVAVVFCDCDVIDDETGEVVFEYGDILDDDDIDRILALNAVYCDSGGWKCTARRYERGSSSIGAALCSLVMVIALIVFLVVVAIGLRLPVDLWWLPRAMGF